MKSLDEENESRRDLEFVEAETAGPSGKRKTETRGSRGKKKPEKRGSPGNKKAEPMQPTKPEPSQLGEENTFKKIAEIERQRPSSLPAKLTKVNLGVENDSFVRDDSDSQDVSYS